jgi:hypothetical protein
MDGALSFLGQTSSVSWHRSVKHLLAQDMEVDSEVDALRKRTETPPPLCGLSSR